MFFRVSENGWGLFCLEIMGLEFGSWFRRAREFRVWFQYFWVQQVFGERMEKYQYSYVVLEDGCCVFILQLDRLRFRGIGRCSNLFQVILRSFGLVGFFLGQRRDVSVFCGFCLGIVVSLGGQRWEGFVSQGFGRFYQVIVIEQRFSDCRSWFRVISQLVVYIGSDIDFRFVKFLFFVVRGFVRRSFFCKVWQAGFRSWI